MKNLWIYNNEFEQIDVIDDYTSLIWAKRYNEIGDCEVYVSANQRNLSMLQKGYYIARDDDDMICRIESVELDANTEKGDYLIVAAYDCRKILNQRVVWTQINFKGTVEDFIRKIIDDNVINPSLQRRKISNFTLGTRVGLVDTIEIQCTYDYLFDKIKELSATYGYGSKVTFDGTNFIFDLYQGVDRSFGQEENNPVIFSPEFENLISTTYKEDSTNVKTSALVAGEGEGFERVREEIDVGTGLDRYELFVDARDISSEIPYEDLIATYPNGRIVVENDIVYYVVNSVKIAILNHVDAPTSGKLIGNNYKNLLYQKGVESLSETNKIIIFEGEVEPFYSYKYGEDYFLGDIVTVKNEYGIEADARITEVIESDDDKGYSIIPTFEYMEIPEPQPLQVAALLTEYSEPITTEDGMILEVEEPSLLRSVNVPSSVESVKISELPESTDVYEGCCMPIVTNGETKKITYGLLKEKLETDLDISSKIPTFQIDDNGHLLAIYED